MFFLQVQNLSKRKIMKDLQDIPPQKKKNINGGLFTQLALADFEAPTWDFPFFPTLATLLAGTKMSRSIKHLMGPMEARWLTIEYAKVGTCPRLCPVPHPCVRLLPCWIDSFHFCTRWECGSREISKVPSGCQVGWPAQNGESPI